MIDPDYMGFAEKYAKNSPCLRRKYGVVIADDSPDLTFATNERIGRCCEGNICVRDRFSDLHGQRIEQGAEVHAEICALLDWTRKPGQSTFYLAGFDKKGDILTGKNVWPCHYCCLALIKCGFTFIVIRTKHGTLEYVSVYEIMEELEAEWTPII